MSHGRTPVNLAVALTAVSQAMYSSSLWESLSNALKNAQQGTGRGLLNLYDYYFQRDFDGTWGNELEAFNAILCLDDPGPKPLKKPIYGLQSSRPLLPDYGRAGLVDTVVSSGLRNQTHAFALRALVPDPLL